MEQLVLLVKVIKVGDTTSITLPLPLVEVVELDKLDSMG